MTAHKPGRIFWLVTRVAEIWAPGTGKRRINDRMREIYDDSVNANVGREELAHEVRHLRRGLYIAEGLNNLMCVQDEMNAAIIQEPEFVNQKLPTGSSAEEAENTLSLYNPFGTPEVMAKGLLGIKTPSENPSTISAR